MCFRPLISLSNIYFANLYWIFVQVNMFFLQSVNCHEKKSYELRTSITLTEQQTVVIFETCANFYVLSKQTNRSFICLSLVRSPTMRMLNLVFNCSTSSSKGVEVLEQSYVVSTAETFILWASFSTRCIWIRRNCWIDF